MPRREIEMLLEAQKAGRHRATLFRRLAGPAPNLLLLVAAPYALGGPPADTAPNAYRWVRVLGTVSFIRGEVISPRGPLSEHIEESGIGLRLGEYITFSEAVLLLSTIIVRLQRDLDDASVRGREFMRLMNLEGPTWRIFEDWQRETPLFDGWSIDEEG